VHPVEVGLQESEPDAVLGGLTRDDVDPDEALSAVADALEMTDLYWPPQDDPDYTLTRALARWRTSTGRGSTGEVEWRHLPDDDRRWLLDDFLAVLRDDVDPGVAEILADTFIDFGDGYLHGGVLAWSPGEVERFMLDWVHRKVLLEPECVDALPGVLAAWVEFALRRRGLAPEHVAPVVAQVIALEDEYADAADDSNLARPAKEILTRLVADGIDLSDKGAVASPVSAYNASRLARGLDP